MNLSENFVIEKNLNRNVHEGNKMSFGVDLKNQKESKLMGVFNTSMKVFPKVETQEKK